jgi:hypothetical protein
LVNQQEIRKRVLEAIGRARHQGAADRAAAEPDPKLLIEGMKEQRAKEETGAKVRSQDAIAANNLASRRNAGRCRAHRRTPPHSPKPPQRQGAI